MNKQRKNQVKANLDLLRALKRSLRAEPPTRKELKDKLTEIQKEIETLHQAEEKDYENMSEKEQCSNAGETAEECIALLEDAMDYMDELLTVSIADEEAELIDLGDSMDDVIELLDEILAF